MPVYLVHMIRGLQRFVLNELDQKLPRAETIAYTRDTVVLRYEGKVNPLTELRSVEALFLCLRHLEGVDRSRSQLRRIQAAAQVFAAPAAIAEAQRFGLRWRGRLRIRVKASMVGRHNFRRVDAQSAVEQGLLAREDLRCQIDRTHPHVEVHVEIRDGQGYLLWKLTDERFRQHAEKRVHRPASLRPSVAYALVQASHPSETDIFLDPMCGAGTILLERAHSGRYGYLLGGDLEAEALEAARMNIGRRHQPLALFCWDTRHLPLQGQAINRIACNLPFGRQLALPDSHFYHDFLNQARRVIHANGSMSLLVSEKTRVMAAAKQTSWRPCGSTTISLLGQRAFILAFRPV